MDILFVADPLEGFKTNHDTSHLLMETLVKRVPDARLHHCGNRDLRQHGGRAVALSREFAFSQNQNPSSGGMWFEWKSEAALTPLADFDAVVMRSDPPFDMPYYYATHLLTLGEKEGALVLNRASSLREYNEKLAILRYPDLISPTIVTADKNEILAFLDEHGDVIVKPLDGMGGMGIFRLRSDGMNTGSILETMLKDGRTPIMAQKFLPAIVDGDKRILVVDGKPSPYAVVRLAKKGETRANMAAGGHWVIREINEDELRVANRIIPDLVRDGIMIAGLDIIGDKLTEINVTSPTCMREVLQETGHNLAEPFVDGLLRLVGNK